MDEPRVFKDTKELRERIIRELRAQGDGASVRLVHVGGADVIPHAEQGGPEFSPQRERLWLRLQLVRRL